MREQRLEKRSELAQSTRMSPWSALGQPGVSRERSVGEWGAPGVSLGNLQSQFASNSEALDLFLDPSQPGRCCGRRRGQREGCACRGVASCPPHLCGAPVRVIGCACHSHEVAKHLATQTPRPHLLHLPDTLVKVLKKSKMSPLSNSSPLESSPSGSGENELSSQESEGNLSLGSAIANDRCGTLVSYCSQFSNL